MSTGHDTFTTFVDTLATHLDDHEARGAGDPMDWVSSPA